MMFSRVGVRSAVLCRDLRARGMPAGQITEPLSAKALILLASRPDALEVTSTNCHRR
jgi:hypothetical protein